MNKYRAEFPVTDNYTFMNHAAVSPVPLKVVRAAETLFQEFSHRGIAHYPKWMDMISRVRGLFANLINAADRELAFVGNTSEGLGIIASGLEWKEGDALLLPVPEFPANVYPWMNLKRHGVEVITVQRKNGRFGVKELKKALVPKVKLVSVSSVHFSTGFLCDLEAIGDFCSRKGLLFCVDAIQSLGVVPMDVRQYGIHFLAAGGHKWLLSPMGCGGLFIADEVLDQVHVERVGWKSVVKEEEFFKIHFDLKPDALRFEPGTMNVAGICALGAAIELLLEVGMKNVCRKVMSINDLLIQGLKDRNLKIITPMEREERSGILSFTPSCDAKLLFKFLASRNVMVSLRNNMIRLSPHFYNNDEDVRRFFETLDGFSG